MISVDISFKVFCCFIVLGFLCNGHGFILPLARDKKIFFKQNYWHQWIVCYIQSITIVFVLFVVYTILLFYILGSLTDMFYFVAGFRFFHLTIPWLLIHYIAGWIVACTFQNNI
jgi:hypothetical protein